MKETAPTNESLAQFDKAFAQVSTYCVHTAVAALHQVNNDPTLEISTYDENSFLIKKGELEVRFCISFLPNINGTGYPGTMVDAFPSRNGKFLGACERWPIEHIDAQTFAEPKDGATLGERLLAAYRGILSSILSS